MNMEYDHEWCAGKMRKKMAVTRFNGPERLRKPKKSGSQVIRYSGRDSN
jgi:hypothetical protein